VARICIIGGGPAGCAVALALYAQGQRDIAVFEAGDHSQQRMGESLPPDIALMFERLGIQQAFLAEQHSPCMGSASAWGSDALGHNDFIASPHGPGWHLDRLRFERFLAQQVRERGLAVHTQTRVQQVQRHAHGGFVLQLQTRVGQQRLERAQWVIDASGVQAGVAARLGARRRMYDQLLAVAGVFMLDADDDFPQLTLLEACEYGWWYAARLPDRRVLAMVASDAPTLKALKLDQSPGWLSALARTAHLAPALAASQWRPQKLAVQLAASSQLEPCAGAGWIAVGDAACCFDPLSSRGIYKAFGDAEAAARAICADPQAHHEPAATLPYRLHQQRQFSDYLQQRAHLYALEQRWPQSGFWQRRQAVSAAA
jgi:flavin-dependent dehydrogenase